MKKRIATVLLGAVLTVMLAVPSFAASGINAAEQRILDQFTNVVYSQNAVMQRSYTHANQYISEATNALIQVDLNEAACADLSQAISDVDTILTGNNITTHAQAREILPTILARVNATANLYGMNVTVDSNGFAYVTITVPVGPKTDGSASTQPAPAKKITTVASTGNPVKQTGFDLTVTMAAMVLLMAAFAGSVTYVFKNRSLVRY